MRKFFHVALLCSLVHVATGQDLLTSRSSSYHTFVYRITDSEAARLYRGGMSADSTYFHTLVHSYPTDSVWEETLPPGHYLRTYLLGSTQQVELTTVQPFQVAVLNNSTDLQLKVYAPDGMVIPNARVRVGMHRIGYDRKTQTYRKHKASVKGTLRVQVDGLTGYYHLEKHYRNAWGRRVSRKVINGTPLLRYVWRPVRFVGRLPVDGVKSLVRGYPWGTISQTGRFFQNAFYRVACRFDDYYCDMADDRSWRFSSKYQSLTIFDKPKYFPTDTLHLKAYLTTIKGRPVNRPVQLVLEKGSDVRLATLHPQRPGVYVFHMPFSDSLQLRLDRHYQLSFRKNNRKTYHEATFRLEEYELTSVQMEAALVQEALYPADSLHLTVSGRSENGLRLQDGRVQVHVTARQVHDFFENTFVPDTLLYHEQPLEAQQDTQVKLSLGDFPAVNMELDVVVNVLTADNERLSETLTASYAHRQQAVEYRLELDTVTFYYLEDGVEQSREVTLWGEDGFGNPVNEMQVILPARLPVNPWYHSYGVRVNGKVQHLNVGEEAAALTFNSVLAGDSLVIQSVNPRRIPFTWYLYRKNHLQKRGFGTSLSLQKRTKNKGPYYLAVQYLWGGQVQEENYQVVREGSGLRMQFQAPDLVYPGQQTTMEVVVTNDKGKPVSGVDVLAHGLTAKFHQSPGVWPLTPKERQQRVLINTFSAKEKEPSMPHRPIDYDFWNPVAGLDSIAWFQFAFPGKEMYHFEYTPDRGGTQFSPYVLRDGEVQPVWIVYVDEVPVYFSWTSHDPYAFAVDSGFHQVKIRTPLHLYELDRVYFPYGKRLILSFDADDLPAGVTDLKTTYQWTSWEKTRLPKYLFTYRNQFQDKTGYFNQWNRYFLVKPGMQVGTVGPVVQSVVGFKLFGGFDMQFTHEPGFEYDLAPGLLKMRTTDTENLLPRWHSSKAVLNLHDEVWTDKGITEYWQQMQKASRMASRRYQNPTRTGAQHGQLVLRYPPDSANVVNTFLFKLDDADFVRVYPGRQAVLHALDGGPYRVILLHEDGQYQTIDTLKVATGGVNYRVLTRQPWQPADRFSARMDSLMNVILLRPISNPINAWEANELFRNYQQGFQYTGPGEVFSGYVYDSSDDMPVPGVSVLVKGTTIGTITNMDGFYSLKAPYGATLVFSFIGYVPEEVTAGSSARRDVFLEQDVQALEEVVVVGYAVSMKRDVTGAVATVTNGLPGMVAGVQIRGASSLSGDQSPLIVIDGVPYLGDLSQLDPSLMTGTEVLKGEAATALYGARAANGVLLISTGKVGLSAKGADLNETFLQEAGEASAIRQNFSDVAFWRPALSTDAQGKARFQVTFPDDITRWDVHLYAFAGKKKRTVFQHSIKSYKPLMAQLSVPRFAIAGDSVTAIGRTVNYLPDSVQVQAVFERNDTLTSTWQGWVADARVDSLHFVASGEDSLTLKYVLRRPDGYFDGEQRSLPIFRAGVEKSHGQFATLRGDTAVNWSFDPAHGPVTVKVTGRSPELLRNHWQWLVNYPYGCNEQLASRLKALLLGEDLADVWEVKVPRDREIKAIIRKLTTNQNDNGLWGWWGRSSTQLWVSVHVAEALTLAQKVGYQPTLNQKNLADELGWNLASTVPAARADWLYLAAMLSPQLNLADFTNGMDTVTLDTRASLRWAQVQQLMGRAPSLQWVKDSLRHDRMGGLYFPVEQHSPMEQAHVAFTVQALRLLRRDTSATELCLRLENYLLDQASRSYRNTYQLANVLEVLLPGLSQQPARGEAQVWLGEQLAGALPIRQQLHQADVNLRVSSAMPMYVSAYQQVWVHQPTADTVHFVVRTAWTGGDDELKGGQPEKLIVTVDNAHVADYVLVEIPIPAGCTYAAKPGPMRGEVHREYYREKVSVFLERLPQGRHQFTVELLPRYSGHYTLNPAKVELMYHPVFQGHEGVRRVVVE